MQKQATKSAYAPLCVSSWYSAYYCCALLPTRFEPHKECCTSQLQHEMSRSSTCLLVLWWKWLPVARPAHLQRAPGSCVFYCHLNIWLRNSWITSSLPTVCNSTLYPQRDSMNQLARPPMLLSFFLVSLSIDLLYVRISSTFQIKRF
jgi:hypothetical protein